MILMVSSASFTTFAKMKSVIDAMTVANIVVDAFRKADIAMGTVAQRAYTLEGFRRTDTRKQQEP